MKNLILFLFAFVCTFAKADIVYRDNINMNGNNISGVNDFTVLGNAKLNVALDGPLRSSLGVVSSGPIDLATETAGTLPASKVQYLTGVTSDVQTQLNGKEPTITTLPASKVQYLGTVTSDVQTQLNGKVTGAASSTNNAIPTFDGTTGKIIKNSGATLNDAGEMRVPFLVEAGNLGFGGNTIYTTNTDGNIHIQPNGNGEVTFGSRFTIYQNKGIRLFDDNSSNFVDVKAAGTTTVNYTWSFPPTAGSAGEILFSNGTSTYWGSIPPSASSLQESYEGGNTITTTNVDGGFTLSGTENASLNGVQITPSGAVSTSGNVSAGSISLPAMSNNRVMVSSGGNITEAAAITANRAVVSNANGLPTAATTTATELGYVNGVTSSIQTQLDAKAAGPASSTNNAIAVFNGTTGKVLRNSVATLTASGNITTTGNITSSGAAGIIQAANINAVGGSGAGGIIAINDSTGSNGINIFTPATLASSYALTLPTTDGNANEYLKTDGSGTLSWGGAATATQMGLVQGGQVPGTTTNDNATAGNVGEYIETIITTPTNLTSASVTAVGSIALTAGDWDVATCLELNTTSAVTSTSYMQLGLNNVSGSNIGLTLGKNYMETALFKPSTTNIYSFHCLPLTRVSIAATTTYYANVLVNYSGGQYTAEKGAIMARRVR